MSAATILADELKLVLVAHRLRRRTAGRTCALCVMSAAPLIEVDCVRNSHWTRPGLAAEAQRLANQRLGAQPLSRGHISHLYDRVRRERGLPEVKRTWRTGLRSLRAEPRHVLWGGDAA
jgi:hypothetical protein